MASAFVLPFEWTVDNLSAGTNPSKTSDFISFRGEKTFRVRVDFSSSHVDVFFVAVHLNRLGLKLKQVTASVSSTESDPPQVESALAEHNDSVSLNLLKRRFPKSGAMDTCTIRFHIHLEGTIGHFSFQSRDTLIKNQFWTLLLDGFHSDIGLIVEDETFNAHKQILASQSPVFAAEFVKNESIVYIEIENVSPSAVEEFLHFVYTGQPLKSFANDELLQLAVRYQVKSLIDLVEFGLKKMEKKDLIDYATIFNQRSINFTNF